MHSSAVRSAPDAKQISDGDNREFLLTRARWTRDRTSVIADELDARRGKYSRNKTARRWGKKRLGDAPATRVRRRSAKFARLQVLEKEREREIGSCRAERYQRLSDMASPSRTSLPRAMYSHDAMPVNSLSAAYFDEIRLKVFRYCPTSVNTPRRHKRRNEARKMVNTTRGTLK